VAATEREIVAERARRGLPRPGWYSDPAGGGHRWWDGSAWTAQVVDARRANLAARPPRAPLEIVPAGAARSVGPRGASRPDVRSAARAESAPAWVGPTIAGLVVTGAVLVVLGSVLPWVRASAPGAVAVTRLGTDGRAGWATIAAGVVVALEAGRWLQRRRSSRPGAVVALLVGVGAAIAAVAGFAHLAAGVASLAGATGPVTRTAGVGVPLVAAGCVAMFSGAVAGALS